MSNEKRKRSLWRGCNENLYGLDQKKWRQRMAVLVSFMDEADETVMDLGAGNMQLENLLKESQKYYPVDYTKRAENTIVCDFNQHQFPQMQTDVIFAAGILEYIVDVEWFLDAITSRCKKLILSYKGKEKHPDNGYETKEIIELLRQRGFLLMKQDDSLEEWTLLGCFEKITPHNLCKIKHCTICGACINACPIGAIRLASTDDIYKHPVCDETKCVSCGICLQVCPELHEKINTETMPDTYGVWANLEMRMKSSSGGFFGELATYILEQGGCVYGVAFQQDFTVHHVEITGIHDLETIQHSKYLRSDTEDTFRQVSHRISQGKKVLYVGTPCQIAGLVYFLGGYENISDQLILVDCICAYAPEPSYFSKWTEENYGDQLAEVTFREKTNFGWSSNGFKIIKKNGETEYPEICSDSDYRTGFHSRLFMNDTCAQCRYPDFKRVGDITIGDFWGIDNHDASWNDGRGTSLVFINTEKGRVAFEQIKERLDRVEQVPSEWALCKTNRIKDGGIPPHKNRHYFTELLQRYGMNRAIRDGISGRHDIVITSDFETGSADLLCDYAVYEYLNSLGYTGKYLLEGGNCYFLKNLFSQADFRIDRNGSFYVSEECSGFIRGSQGNATGNRILLLPEEKLSAMAEIGKIRYKGFCGVLVYLSDGAGLQKLEELKDRAELLSDELLVINDSGVEKENTIMDAAVEELAYLVREAREIYTDSFAVVCLALKLKKEFLYIGENTKTVGNGKLDDKKREELITKIKGEAEDAIKKSVDNIMKKGQRIGENDALLKMLEYHGKKRRTEEANEIADKTYEQLQIKRFKMNYELMYHWRKLNQIGKTVADFLESHSYGSVAVYGAGEIGWECYKEIQNSDCRVAFFIDRNPENNFVKTKNPKISVINLQSDPMEKVDAVIITPISIAELIQDDLSGRYCVPIISLEEMINSQI